MKKQLLALILILVAVAFTGCFPGGRTYSPEDPAGFFSGIWHGWIAPLTLIVGLFNHDVRIYEPFNTGWWYDFGFYIAIISGFGSIALTRKGKKADRGKS